MVSGPAVRLFTENDCRVYKRLLPVPNKNWKMFGHTPFLGLLGSASPPPHKAAEYVLFFHFVAKKDCLLKPGRALVPYWESPPGAFSADAGKQEPVFYFFLTGRPEQRSDCFFSPAKLPLFLFCLVFLVPRTKWASPVFWAPPPCPGCGLGPPPPRIDFQISKKPSCPVYPK